jgi:hypothetical protein
MVLLIFAWLSVGVDKIRNRRPAQQDRFLQYFLQGAVQNRNLFRAQIRSELCWMNPGAPQTFICIDISDSPQHRLIQQ